MSAKTDVDFVLFIYSFFLSFFVSKSVEQDFSHASESVVLPLFLR